MKLYEISNSLRDLLDELDEAEGELSEDLEHRLDVATMALTEKIDNVLAFAAEREAYADALRGEMERLGKRAKSVEATADSLRKYVLTSMRRAGIPKVEGLRFTARTQANPGRVVVDDESKIPQEFVNTRTESYIDKRALRDALLKNDVPGAHIEQSISLRIK
jgi:DNA repair exonuclease SbcCD ATPase subunit